MLLNPSVMHKAQAELDSVVGESRMPEFEDADSLPYIQALIKETTRLVGFGLYIASVYADLVLDGDPSLRRGFLIH